MSIGHQENIDKARAILKLLPSKVAQDCALHPDRVSKAFKGLGRLGWVSIQKIAAQYECDPDYLEQELVQARVNKKVDKP
jgi:hypothetical protein